jgi:anti-anti-sigma regulatory factor
MRQDAVQETRVIVTLPAEIDSTNAGQVCDDICAALTPGVDAVVADLTSTVFCDSSCLRQLLLAHDRITASGAQLRSSRLPRPKHPRSAAIAGPAGQPAVALTVSGPR